MEGLRMTTNYKIFKLTSEFLGDKAWGTDTKNQNYNNHKITVVNTETKKRTSFEFWGSIANPEIQTEEELLSAFYCFLSDGISAKDTFENFCGKFGYDEDSRKAEKIYNACKNSLKKLERLYDGDLYELINTLQEEHNL